ncbi:MAG: GC-type dockerin domain-anchored protein [Phycisphaerales bacterium]
MRFLGAGGTIAADTEIADDFLAIGDITRIAVHASNSGFGNRAEGAFVRFYEWTDAGPGVLLDEQFLDIGDPGLGLDPDDPHTADITLPEPFEAAGWHFVSVQLVMTSGTWRPIESNSPSPEYEPINAFVYLRDNLAGGDWQQDDDGFGRPETSDVRMRIYGDVVPIIRSVASTNPATPSGRLVITGSGFGDAPGESTVLIGGREAIVTQRFGQELRAYVPEATPIGMADVQVITAEGSSNIERIGVSPRTPDGRVRWRFQTDHWMAKPQNMAVGPDGRIYTSDQIGLYCLAPDGELVWFLPDAGGGYPIDIGPDGTIYTGPTLDFDLGLGNSSRIYAINPEGTIKWTYDAPQSSDGNLFLENGPSVGPDGNIYALQNKLDAGDVGLGMFSLDPSGNLLWSNPGDPFFRNLSARANLTDIVFADDRLYTGFVYGRGGTCCPAAYAFDLDGQQLWQSGQDGLNVFFTSFPRVDPAGRAIGRRGQTGLISLEPDGDTRFLEYGPGQANLIMPDVDDHGNVYTAEQFGGELWSVDENGATRFFADVGPNANFRTLGVTPDGSQLVLSGVSTFGQPGFFRGYDGDNGSFQWEILLEDERGTQQDASNRYPVFSPDARTAYQATSFSDIDFVKHGYVYAVDLTDGACPADLDGDGEPTIFDFLAFQNLFDAGDPIADFDGDGELTIFDFLAFQNEFDAGCP